MNIKTSTFNNPLNEPNCVGAYYLIENPTPEVEDLLKKLNEFRYEDSRVKLRIIAKENCWDGNLLASIGWKLTFPEVPQVEKEVEDLLRKWYAKL